VPSAVATGFLCVEGWLRLGWGLSVVSGRSDVRGLGVGRG